MCVHDDTKAGVDHVEGRRRITGIGFSFHGCSCGSHSGPQAQPQRSCPLSHLPRTPGPTSRQPSTGRVKLLHVWLCKYTHSQTHDRQKQIKLFKVKKNVAGKMAQQDFSWYLSPNWTTCISFLGLTYWKERNNS